jgi:hypothetical protein
MWCCKLEKFQAGYADSTTEAKYIAALEAAKEKVWMRKFLIELGVFPNRPLEVIIEMIIFCIHDVLCVH